MPGFSVLNWITCGGCNGVGHFVEYPPTGSMGAVTSRTCRTCNGTGRVLGGTIKKTEKEWDD